MNTIMELAAKLGDAIKEDERVQRLKAAEEAYNADKMLAVKVQEFVAANAVEAE